MTDETCLAERRSLSSMFNVRRKSSSKLAPTLVVREEDNSEMSVREPTPQGRSVNSAGAVLSRNGSTLDNPTSDPNEDRRNLQSQPENAKDSTRASKFKIVTGAMFSATARKILCGIAVASGVTISWVSGSHFVKLTYYDRQELHFSNSTSKMLKLLHQGGPYDAPFLTTWLSTASLLLVFPVYSLLQCVRCGRKRDVTAVSGLVDCVRYFRDRGFTLGQFMFRTLLFCLLWVASSYLYFRSLRTLSCTDVAALFSTNVAFVYLLSWVILHQQFVGIRIVGMIMCNTGIALLAYMDGITNSPTLGTVVMAATGSAGLAVYKVCYRKVMGGYELGPVSLFFSLLSLVSSVLLWPLMLTLTLTGAEEVSWSQMPWPQLVAACLLLLVCTLLCTLGSLVTYEIFATLGIILAVPLCAVVDLYWYNEQYNGMRLAGMVLIVCGFVLVLFPNDWPSYIRTFIRCCRIHHGGGQVTQPEPVDYRTGVISRSRLRSPSGHVR